MSKHTYRIAFMAPVEHAEACNRAANALGRSGENFSVLISATGTAPATHIGGSAAETEAFMAAVAVAPQLQDGATWPEALAPEDWQVVADHLTLVSGPSLETDPAEQFEAMLTAAALQRVSS